MVSNISSASGHQAYLPLLNFIPSLYEMLDNIEDTGTNKGHMYLVLPLRQRVDT